VHDANGHALAYVYFEDGAGKAIGGSPHDPRRSVPDRGEYRQAASAPEERLARLSQEFRHFVLYGKTPAR
jgi:hypothetical protein